MATTIVTQALIDISAIRANSAEAGIAAETCETAICVNTSPRVDIAVMLAEGAFISVHASASVSISDT